MPKTLTIGVVTDAHHWRRDGRHRRRRAGRMKCDVVTSRAEPQTVCGAPSRSEVGFCGEHWRMLPKALQDEAWRAFMHEPPGSEANVAVLTQCYVFLNAPIQTGTT